MARTALLGCAEIACFEGGIMPNESPIGSIIMYGGSKDHVPPDWLYCDGSIVSQVEYQELFHYIGHNFGDVVAHPGYDPNTQFYLPDLRGRFIRGVDDTANRDPDLPLRKDMQSDKLAQPGVGSVQDDQFREHTHNYTHLKDEGSGIVSGNWWRMGGDTTTATGGKETRPLNAALYYIIRAK
jgi:microcystin-dependent protein